LNQLKNPDAAALQQQMVIPQISTTAVQPLTFSTWAHLVWAPE